MRNRLNDNNDKLAAFWVIIAVLIFPFYSTCTHPNEPVSPSNPNYQPSNY